MMTMGFHACRLRSADFATTCWVTRCQKTMANTVSVGESPNHHKPISKPFETVRHLMALDTNQAYSGSELFLN